MEKLYQQKLPLPNRFTQCTLATELITTWQPSSIVWIAIEVRIGLGYQVYHTKPSAWKIWIHRLFAPFTIGLITITSLDRKVEKIMNSTFSSLTLCCTDFNQVSNVGKKFFTKVTVDGAFYTMYISS